MRSLELFNYEGLTPLTLAAKCGKVETFKLILYKHMSKEAWKYGKVRRARCAPQGCRSAGSCAR